MKYKFSNNMRVIGTKLDAFHRLKGFKEGEELKVYMIERSGDHDYQYWGLWVKAPRGGFECRLQDLNGNVTGHGTFFEPKSKDVPTPRPGQEVSRDAQGRLTLTMPLTPGDILSARRS